MAKSVTSSSPDRDILQMLVEVLHHEGFQAPSCPGHSDHNVHAEHAVCRVLDQRPSGLRWANGKTDAQIAQDAIKAMREELREEERAAHEHATALREHKNTRNAAWRSNREDMVAHARAILKTVIKGR